STVSACASAPSSVVPSGGTGDVDGRRALIPVEELDDTPRDRRGDVGAESSFFDHREHDVLGQRGIVVGVRDADEPRRLLLAGLTLRGAGLSRDRNALVAGERRLRGTGGVVHHADETAEDRVVHVIADGYLARDLLLEEPDRLLLPATERDVSLEDRGRQPRCVQRSA